MNLARRGVVVVASALLAIGIAAPGSARPMTPSAPTSSASRLPAARPATTNPMIRTVDYGPAALTAFYNPARVDAPWIGLVHGGSWHAGSRAEYAALARRWSRSGYQVFTIDYRLAPAARWPAQRNDVLTAVRYIQGHAAGYRLDASDGVLVGNSAGGQIVADAVDTGAVRVRAVVDLAGPVVPYLAWLDGHNAAPRMATPANRLADSALSLIGCPPQRTNPACWALWTGASAPALVTAHTPPTLIIQSRDDPIVSSRMSTYYAARLGAVRAPYALRILPGATHNVLGVPGVGDRVLAWIRVRTARHG